MHRVNTGRLPGVHQHTHALLAALYTARYTGTSAATLKAMAVEGVNGFGLFWAREYFNPGAASSVASAGISVKLRTVESRGTFTFRAVFGWYAFRACP